jgi:hypothetical protein
MTEQMSLLARQARVEAKRSEYEGWFRDGTGAPHRIVINGVSYRSQKQAVKSSGLSEWEVRKLVKAMKQRIESAKRREAA